MKKGIKALQNLKLTEEYYKRKVKLLSKIITDDKIGYLCPDELVKWCDKVGLKTKNHFEDRTSWWTVSSR